MVTQSNPHTFELDLIQYWRIFLRRKWYGILPAITILALTLLYMRSLPLVYRSEAKIAVRSEGVVHPLQRGPQERVTPSERLAGVEEQILSFISLQHVAQQVGYDQTILLDAESPLKQLSRTALQLVGVNAFQDPVAESMRDEAFSRALAKNLGVRKSKSEDVVTISYTGRSNELNERIANEAMQYFIEQSREEETNLARTTTEYVEKFRKQYTGKLVEAQEKLAAYRLAHPDLNLNPENDPNRKRLGEIRAQFLQEEVNLQVKILHRDRLVRQLQNTDREIGTEVSEQTNPKLARLIQTLHYQEGLLLDLKTRLQPTHPDVMFKEELVKGIESAIELAKNELNTEEVKAANPVWREKGQRIEQLSQEIQNTEQRLALSRQQEERLEQKSASSVAPEQERVLRDLMDEVALYGRIDGIMDNELERAQISQDIAGESRNQRMFKILATARVSYYPIDPLHLQEGAMGLMIALGVGAGLIVLIEYLDTTLRSVKQAKDFFGNLSCLGVVAQLTTPDPVRVRRRRIIVAGATAGVVLLVLVIGYLSLGM